MPEGWGNVASWVSRAIREGLNRVEGAQMFRSAGGRIATETWNRVWGFVRASIRNRALVAAHDPNLPISDFRTGTWAAGQPGKWAIQVDVVIQEGEVVFTRPFTMITDRLVSPSVAVDTAIGRFQQASIESGGESGQEILGAVPTGVYRMTGREG